MSAGFGKCSDKHVLKGAHGMLNVQCRKCTHYTDGVCLSGALEHCVEIEVCYAG